MAEKASVTGGCQCGAIRYEATEEPAHVVICHCRMCQKAYGGPFAAGVGFRRSALTITQGHLKYYQSSSIGRRGFCENCGSPILMNYETYVPDWGEVYFIRLGSLDHPEKYRPRFHYGIESRLPWAHFDDGLSGESAEEDPRIIRAFAVAERNEKSRSQ